MVEKIGKLDGAARIFEIVRGFQSGQLLKVAIEMGIPDSIQRAPKLIDDLAAEIGARPKALFRLLRGLMSQGFFSYESSGKIIHTQDSLLLVSDSESYSGDLVTFFGGPVLENWQNLENVVRSGQTYHERPNESLFNKAMYAMAYARNENELICSAWDFRQYLRIGDIGGGVGDFAWEIKRTAPNSDVFVFDADFTRESVLEGDFKFEVWDVLKGIHPGLDCYTCKRMSHDFGDEDMTSAYKAWRKAMDLDSTLLIIEAIVSEGYDSSPAIMSDLNMLAVTSTGLERTLEEYKSILKEGGFGIRSVKRVPKSPFSIIEANPE